MSGRVIDPARYRRIVVLYRSAGSVGHKVRGHHLHVVGEGHQITLAQNYLDMGYVFTGHLHPDAHGFRIGQGIGRDADLDISVDPKCTDVHSFSFLMAAGAEVIDPVALAQGSMAVQS